MLQTDPDYLGGPPTLLVELGSRTLLHSAESLANWNSQDGLSCFKASLNRALPRSSRQLPEHPQIRAAGFQRQAFQEKASKQESKQATRSFKVEAQKFWTVTFDPQSKSH